MSNETDLVQSCIHWVKESRENAEIEPGIYAWKRHGDAYHVHGSAVQRKGEPDIDGAVPFIFNGYEYVVHFKIECKVGKNEVSPIQAKRLESWNELGYTVGVARSLDEFKTIVTDGVRKQILRLQTVVMNEVEAKEKGVGHYRADRP